MHRKILIMGRPALARQRLRRFSATRLNAVHFNADEVRKHVSKDLGFEETHRVEHAHRMGWLCDQWLRPDALLRRLHLPDPRARRAFLEHGPAFVVWVDRIRTPLRRHDPNVRSARSIRSTGHPRRLGRILGGAGRRARAGRSFYSKQRDRPIHRPLPTLS